MTPLIFSPYAMFFCCSADNISEFACALDFYVYYVFQCRFLRHIQNI